LGKALVLRWLNVEIDFVDFAMALSRGRSGKEDRVVCRRKHERQMNCGTDLCIYTLLRKEWKVLCRKFGGDATAQTSQAVSAAAAELPSSSLQLAPTSDRHHTPFSSHTDQFQIAEVEKLKPTGLSLLTRSLVFILRLPSFIELKRSVIEAEQVTLATSSS
jgi:hypothetical protein